MTPFTAEWLALREPADTKARSAELVRALDAAIGCRDPLHGVDLATGTGANVRYLATRLCGNQEWLLVDSDPHLLSRVGGEIGAWASARGDGVLVGDPATLVIQHQQATWRIVTECLNLATADTRSIVNGARLMTASALLDLVSERWISELAIQCREVGAAALFALTYDGRIQCMPEETGDEAIRQMVNMHQRSDKGFDPALGPDAVDFAERLFVDMGYSVERASSDWCLKSDHSALQTRLVDGWAEAAVAVTPSAAEMIRFWRGRRLAHIAAGRSRIVVGHQDLAAWLR